MSTITTIPPPAALSSSPQILQQVLDALFEPSPALYTLVASHLPRQFATYDEFADFVAELLFSLPADEEGQRKLQQILGSHPRLGAAKVDSAHSREEQKSLAGEAGDEATAERLRELNEKYEETFPGMRYVAFVAGRNRSVIMENMEERIARGDLEAEKKAAIEAMRDIAKDRASKLAPRE